MLDWEDEVVDDGESCESIARSPRIHPGEYHAKEKVEEMLLLLLSKSLVECGQFNAAGAIDA